MYLIYVDAKASPSEVAQMDPSPLQVGQKACAGRNYIPSLAIILLISWTQYPLFSQSILRVHILSFYQVIIIICSVHSHLYTQWNLSYLTENMHFPVFNLRHLIHFLISSRISLNYLNCIVYISGGGGSSFGIFFIEVELIYIMFQAYKKLNTS